MNSELKIIKSTTELYETLTDSQKDSYDDFKDWYINDKSMIYVLTGRAGTGKTYLINALIKDIIKKKRIAVAAPTHKAVRVIENATGLKGMTLHSLHGLRPSFDIDDFNVAKIKFNTSGTIKMANYNILLADEGGMISKPMKDLTEIRAKQYNTKVVYIGDELQLTPVKEQRISTVFTNKHKSTLIEIVRQQATNPLIKILSMLREDIPVDGDTFIKYIRANRNNIEDGHGYASVNNVDFVKVINNYFNSDDFKNNINYVKIGAYTNDRVNQWNRYVRKLTMEANTIIVEGDLLMGYKTIVDKNLNIVVTNSTDYVVDDVSDRLSDDKFKMFVVNIKDLLTGINNYVYIVDHTDESFKFYYRKLMMLHNRARQATPLDRGKLWNMFYNYKDTYMSMVNFELKYDSGYNAPMSKEIDYAYATTIHKLQGSTITNIMIDNLDISYYSPQFNTLRYNTKYNPKAIDTRNRLLYTGLSRASEKAIILIR